MTETEKRLLEAGDRLARTIDSEATSIAFYGDQPPDEWLAAADAWRALVASLEDSHNAAVRQEK